MLTDLPSLEVALLALWKLTIVAAALVFMVIVTMKAAKIASRILRRLKSNGKRKASRQSYQRPDFSRSSTFEEERFSNV